MQHEACHLQANKQFNDMHAQPPTPLGASSVHAAHCKLSLATPFPFLLMPAESSTQSSVNILPRCSFAKPATTSPGRTDDRLKSLATTLPSLLLSGVFRFPRQEPT